MILNDPETWADADTMIEIDEHPQLGQVKVRQWKNLPFYRAAGHPINLILVERIKPMSSGQPFPPLWLAWVDARTLPLATVWEISTPARFPKPRGKSPGWTKGHTRTKPPRYPTVKKWVTRPKKSPKVAA